MTHSNDPHWLNAHLGLPGDNPAPYECEVCHDGYESELDVFAGKRACHGCVCSHHCRECKSAWGHGNSDLCLICNRDFYLAQPAEYTDARPLLLTTEHGREIVMAVDSVLEIEASRVEIQRGMRQLTRQSISQHYREMAVECQEGA
jgi:hypothetical protein